MKLENGERALLYKLRNMSLKDLSEIDSISEGLEFRISKAAGESCGISELLQLLKTKRYPDARLRRVLLNAFLGIKKDALLKAPSITRVLAFNDIGRKMLRFIDASRIEVITKMADAKSDISVSAYGDRLISFFMPEIFKSDLDFNESPIYIK